MPLLFENQSRKWRRRLFVSYQGEEHVIDVPPKHQSVLHLRISADHHGWLQLSRMRIYTQYPLGVLQAWSRPLLKSNCLVYPRPIARDTTASDGSKSIGLASAGRGIDDFAGLEEWQPGVPPQRIAWKQFSAGKGMLEKTFEAQAGNPSWIDWDAYEGLDTEDRLSAMCAKAVEMEAVGQPYGCLLYTSPSPRDRTRSRMPSSA